MDPYDINEMDPYAYSPRSFDPHADSPRVLAPMRRTRDPREAFEREFTHEPVITPFPSTGSLYYRRGVYDGRPMTPKEQRFEEYVNDVQAGHDQRTEVKEWRRRMDRERVAISLYFSLGGDMGAFSRAMRTRDQEEMEFLCHRRKQKAIDLDPQRSMTCVQAMLLKGERGRRAMVAGERVREQLRLSDAALLSKQQAQKRTPDGEEICRQFQDQVQARRPAACKNEPSASPTGLGSSSQQVQEPTLSGPENVPQSTGQAQPAPETTAASPPASPGMAASSQDADGSDLDEPVPAGSEDHLAAEPAWYEYQPHMGNRPGVHLIKGSLLLGYFLPRKSGVRKSRLHESGPSRSSAEVQNDPAANQGEESAGSQEHHDEQQQPSADPSSSEPDGLHEHHDEQQQQPSAEPSSSVPSPQHTSSDEEGDKSTPPSSQPSPPPPEGEPPTPNASLDVNPPSSSNTNADASSSSSNANNATEDLPWWSNVKFNPNRSATSFECLDEIRKTNPYFVGYWSDACRERVVREESRWRFGPGPAVWRPGTWGREIGGIGGGVIDF